MSSLFLEIHLKNLVGEGYVHNLGIENVPMDTNQGTPLKGDHCIFHLFANISSPLMATLNILWLNVGLLVWLLSILNILSVPKYSQMSTLFQGHQMDFNWSPYFPE